jgi:hypothetical protein
MARQRVYATNAERQAAYRARVARRQQQAADGRLAARVAQLEQQLAEAVGRAETAEQRAAVTEGRLVALKTVGRRFAAPPRAEPPRADQPATRTAAGAGAGGQGEPSGPPGGRT